MQWESLIVARMSLDAPVAVSLDGDYSAPGNSGTVSATFRNDSTAEISGRVIILITEDSLFYPAANISWHNHVPRNYIPDYNGTLVTIPAGDSVTVTYPFTTHPNWQKDQCRILAWVQNDVMQADSTKEIWQGGMVALTELGIAEDDHDAVTCFQVKVVPNPCVERVSFAINTASERQFIISIYDVSGRRITELCGMTATGTTRLNWDLRDRSGTRAASGIYFYEFRSADMRITGKLIIR
jgi:hypothetical protein